ncbi:ABC transporter ATP-binding protein [Lactobacillus sp. CC-MHH1034]|uniref:ABC transporter ATP-binding protein n=1 Tax=Agrilactobacillus fermenti TaxID=2586909 RepID=UPI001E4902F4|nr:ABC transporter ATP-binding protein [Agrilactobacillus fermenti]MCD2255282.1 ABC transporter ATP-binding protein [Agrilactobacillus fermenti]
MQLMIRYSLRYKKLILLNLFFVLGFALIELGLPTLLGQMIDNGINKNRVQGVFQYGGLMYLIIAIGMIGLIGLAYTGSRLTNNIVRDIRDDIFKSAINFSQSEYKQISGASLITRSTNDAFQVMTFLQMVFRTGFMTPLMFIVSGVMIVRTNAFLSIFVFLAIPVLLLGILVIAHYSEPMSEKQQANLDKINQNMRENLSGIRVIRAFVREKFQQQRFADVNQAYAKSSINLYTLMAMSQPAFSFVFNIVFALILWQGTLSISAGNLAIGSLIAFVEYIFHVLFSFLMFSSVFMLYPRAAVSAKRIQEVLDTKSEIKAPEQPVQQKIKGHIQFEKVTFSYTSAEEPVIRDVTLDLPAGKTTAFIGSTGSGKSTLIQLIPRFYDITDGRLSLDGIGIDQYQIQQLRQQIGFVPQKAMLFQGTVRDNLKFGKTDASDDEIWQALTIAQAKDFVQALPDQLDTEISESGSNFSGGQKQRLSIARAIVRQPAIYIFDDSFSALDYKTDLKLRQALYHQIQDATILIVAQRISTIMNADQIVVLNRGQVVGVGTHASLLKTNQVYQDIAYSQLSKEELS